jgi:hypothetical protein
MVASVTVSVVEQWQGEDISEIKESKSDDADDTDGEEKIENEVYTLNHNIFIEILSFPTEKLKKTNNYGKNTFISELYASLPELPPEA